MSNFDFSFYNWTLIQDFVLKGFAFSLQLTLIAMIGGILIGTLLALMRLSGIKWLEVPATIYVNGRPLIGAQPYEVFKQVIDEELARVGAK